MKNKIKAITLAVLLWGGIAAAETSDISLKATMEFLSNLGSRAPGYEGNLKAADYIEETFIEILHGKKVKTT